MIHLGCKMKNIMQLDTCHPKLENGHFADCKMPKSCSKVCKSLRLPPIAMRNRDPHRENVENILAICLPIVTMQHIRESPSPSHGMRKSAWNDPPLLIH